MRMIVGLLLVGIFAAGHFASAEMSSTNFLIQWDTISQGGADDHASASYLLRDTVGNAGAGVSSSASYDLRAGYRAGILDQVLDFAVEAQTMSSGRTATALAGETVTADESGISVGDLVALIQDEGDGQVTAIGRVTATAVGSVTVDEWKDGGVAPVIDGAGDTLYVLEADSIDLGQLDDGLVTTALVAFEVTADLQNGYTIRVIEDGDLRIPATSNTIGDVSDGDVTAGSNEYGGRSSDTDVDESTFDTADTAFTNEFQEIADELDASFESRNFVTLSASITSGNTDGDYSHVLSFIVSGNF